MNTNASIVSSKEQVFHAHTKVHKMYKNAPLYEKIKLVTETIAYHPGIRLSNILQKTGMSNKIVKEILHALIDEKIVENRNRKLYMKLV